VTLALICHDELVSASLEAPESELKRVQCSVQGGTVQNNLDAFIKDAHNVGSC